MNKKLIVGAIVIILLGVAYYLLSPLFIVKELNDPMPVAVGNGSVGAGGLTLSRGVFVASAHEVSGEAKIIGLPDEKKFLRFEDFETVNGPDLFIYLATDNTAEDFVNLGEIKATRGNVNYAIPAGTDLDKYNTVLIWCKQFRVLFSYAELG